MKNELKLVFSNYQYVVIACVIFTALFLTLSIISEFIFLEPYIIGHIPNGTELGFSLIVAVSALSGLVLAMNVYRIKVLRNSKRKMGGGVFGSIVGAATGACSCGPIGFAIISTFGSVGGVATSFLTNYEIPLRIAAVAILAITYFITIKSLRTECGISPKEQKTNP
ncbi:MAG: hypothetical protein GWN01_02090 [Nitrosopumilaceae archaeon]|nr:hypothetical protein [Nitrosopumilaceae archaeon]NIT99764.1 hypothetical protein [Nitrosopumilaceae archaeon]NIU88626.1 hypothetical protein [Nitrosopumilaceae archaeon]NIV64900.1 hypothetical protein [Nitrosopumilaceae archaeon]NIX60367.1 hypothetical protein [Nitrosopumilaceae archaeon]